MTAKKRSKKAAAVKPAPTPETLSPSEDAVVASDAGRLNFSLFAAGRIDTADHSTIKCKCGASLTWGEPNEHTDAWVNEHSPHMQAAAK